MEFLKRLLKTFRCLRVGVLFVGVEFVGVGLELFSLLVSLLALPREEGLEC